VLMGGLSAEREVSLRSGAAVAAALASEGYRVTPLDVGRDVAAKLAEIKPDVCFNALHGRFGEDGCIQGVLECAGIPYTHSGVLSSALAMHKERAKDVMGPAGVPVADAHVVTRRQGIMVAAGNPKDITSVADLARPNVRFVNRQPGSGTRLILEELLARAKVKASRIGSFDRAEYTHAAVAAYIASGMADAGVGVETAARQFHLGFVPLVQERYFLAFRHEALSSPPVERLLEAMRSREFKAQIVRLQGLDANACGTVLELREAFPGFAQWSKRSARAKAPRAAPSR